jgi:hypothetical protein
MGINYLSVLLLSEGHSPAEVDDNPFRLGTLRWGSRRGAFCSERTPPVSPLAGLATRWDVDPQRMVAGSCVGLL